jgi:hypothetical protein
MGFIFNWSVPKAANKCYHVWVEAMDGTTTMTGPGGTPIHEAYFKSK